MAATINNRLTTNLWFNREAEEAVDFYTSVFQNSKKKRVSRYGKEGHEVHGMPEGTAMTVEFELDGNNFVALNGGPHFKFTEAISFIINCASQDEVDYYWNKLSEGGDAKAQMCGWLKDKYGLSWQVIPTILPELLTGNDKARSGRVMNAMLKMKKIEIPKLQEAASGASS